MVFYEWKHDPQFRAAVGQDMQKIELQGAFEGCPIPTLIMEGKWDLTWNTDKPEKLQKDHPGSKLVMFDASSHDPFEDEPERFFEELKGFIQGLPPIPNQDLAQWRKYLADREERLARSPAHIVRSMGYGVKSNALIAEAYTREWLNQLDDPGLLLKTGFALYDQRRYEDALAVFRKMTEQTKDNPFYLAVSLIWQGHMLDLLGRRKEAVEVYKRVADMGVTGGMEHSQFGLRYSPSPYAKERMEKPFERMENRDQN
jgi:tetratricopeptide (TPR) repeat protein